MELDSPIKHAVYHPYDDTLDLPAICLTVDARGVVRLYRPKGRREDAGEWAEASEMYLGAPCVKLSIQDEVLAVYSSNGLLKQWPLSSLPTRSFAEESVDIHPPSAPPTQQRDKPSYAPETPSSINPRDVSPPKPTAPPTRNLQAIPPVQTHLFPQIRTLIHAICLICL